MVQRPGRGARARAGEGLRRAGEARLTAPPASPAAAVGCPDLVLLGNLIVDDVVFADGVTRMGEAGGAILYAALGAALWPARVGVTAPLGDNYPRAMLEALEARGVNTSALRPLGRGGLRTWLLYEPRARRVLHHLGSPTHAEASPSPGDVPPGWSSARAFHVAPIPLECQQPLVRSLAARPGAWLSLDPHDPITEGTLARWRETLAQLDMLFVSDEELQLGDADPAERMRRLAGGRLALVALKRGARGGMLYDVRADRVIEWAPRSGVVVDPTGAGDAFCAGFLTAHLAGSSLEAALRRGVVTASFALEDWGAAGLLHATPAMALERGREWYGAEART